MRKLPSHSHLHLDQSSCHLIQIISFSQQSFLRDHHLLLLLLATLLTAVVPIIESSPLVGLCWLKQVVCKATYISELGKASEEDDLLDQSQELPFKGGDQGFLLLKRQAEQVAMVIS